jgi:O-antigen/teichoic acid export membrane protein
MSFLRNVSSLALNRFVGAVLSVIILSLSARLLSPDELGSLVAVTATIALLVRIASLGMGQSAQFYGARETIEKRFFGYALIVAAIPITIFSLVVLLFAGHIIGGLVLTGDPLAQQLFNILKFGIPLMCIHLLASLYFLGTREMRCYFFLSNGPILGSVLVLGWAILIKQGLQTVVSAWMAQYILSFLLGCVFLLKKPKLPSVPLLSSVTNLYNYGVRSFFIFLATFAVTRISLIVGLWFTSSSEVGFFATSRTFADALLLIYGIFGPLIFSYVGGMDDPKIFLPFIERICRLSFILFSGLSICLAAIAPIGIPLIFGKAYVGSYPVVWILLPGLVFNSIQRTLENYLYGRRKQSPLVFCHVMSISILILGSALFAPHWGAHGLALASTISCVASFVFTATIAYRTDGLNPLYLLLPRASDFRFLAQRIRRLGLEYGTRVDQ